VSNIIDFLERLGGDAGLRHASDDAVEAALKLAGIDQAVRSAIVAKDQSALEALLGANTNVCCMINKPDEEEEEEEDDDEDDDDEDDEDEDEEFDEDDDEDEDDEDDEDEDDDEDEIENMGSFKRVADRVA
jgi:hypothetical protein